MVYHLLTAAASIPLLHGFADVIAQVVEGKRNAPLVRNRFATLSLTAPHPPSGNPLLQPILLPSPVVVVVGGGGGGEPPDAADSSSEPNAKPKRIYRAAVVKKKKAKEKEEEEPLLGVLAALYAKLPEEDEEFVWRRSMRVMSVCLFNTPLKVLRVILLNHLLPGVGLDFGLAKALINQCLFEPVHSAMSMALYQGIRTQSWRDIKEKVRQDWLDLQLVAWVFHIPQNFIAFAFMGDSSEQLWFKSSTEFLYHIYVCYKWNRKIEAIEATEAEAPAIEEGEECAAAIEEGNTDRGRRGLPPIRSGQQLPAARQPRENERTLEEGGGGVGEGICEDEPTEPSK